MIAPRELADRHGLDMQTPLLTLSRAPMHALWRTKGASAA
jgi:hypothetical protein